VTHVSIGKKEKIKCYPFIIYIQGVTHDSLGQKGKVLLLSSYNTYIGGGGVTHVSLGKKEKFYLYPVIFINGTYIASDPC
jgi:hypothetical protein